MGDMGGDKMGDILFGKSVIVIFFSLKLIQCKSNISSDNKYF